ncbi:MAG: methyltransferase domain-containing protein [Pirellulaceae bacterium]
MVTIKETPSRFWRVRKLVHRDRQPEWMDQPELEAVQHHRALHGLAVLNWWSGRSRPYHAPIRRLVPQVPGSLRILDLACGGGDVAIHLARWGKRQGLRLEIVGIDRSDVAIEFARHNAQRAGVEVEFIRHTIGEDPLPEGFDVVLASLFLHHLDEGDAVELLRSVRQSVRHAVLVNDLVRSPLAYTLVWWASRLLTRSPVVHYDGPRSVAAAFTPPEMLDIAAQAGWDRRTVVRCFPCRMLLQCWK